jgi:subtilisin-like proprotein convertase family protein
MDTSAVRTPSSLKRALAVLTLSIGLALALTGALLFWLGGPSVARAAGTFYVATTGSDANTCATTADPCASIQAAIGKAASGDTLQVAAGTYITSAVVSEVVHITQSLTLSGGWNAAFTAQTGVSVIDAQNMLGQRGLTVDAGVIASIERFVIQNGNLAPGNGGGVENNGTLTLQHFAVMSSTADLGGGLYNNGTAFITNTTLGGNTAAMSGGGLYNAAAASASLENVTASANTASAGDGGGLYNGGALTLHNSLVANNTDSNDNSSPDLSGAVTSSGYNLVGKSDGAGGFVGTDLTGTVASPLDPLLGAFDGQVYTLLSGSPALNSADPGSCPATDQLGSTRPQGARCDIGAFEKVRVQFSGAPFSVSEAGATALVTVTLSNPAGFAVSVNYATSNGSATGSDYTAASGALTFNPGDTSESFTVSITNDITDEGDETINLTLSGAGSRASLEAPNPTTLTILDDDLEPIVNFDAMEYSVSEAAGTATLTATLSHPSAFQITVNYTTLDGTAISGSDYITSTSVLTFAPGSTQETLALSLVNDPAYENSEFFTVELTSASGAILGTPNPARVDILNDDPRPNLAFDSAVYTVNEAGGQAAITVVLSGTTNLTTTVNYATSDGTANAGDYTAAAGTLTFAPGDASESFNVSITDDSVYEVNETIVLTLSGETNADLGAPNPATLIITPDSDPAPTVQLTPPYSLNEDAGPAVITVTLTGATDITATALYTTTAATATPGADYLDATGALTFSPGTTQQTFTVTVNADTTYELDDTFTVTIGAPVSATLGSTTSAGVTITNDDPLPSIRYTPDPQTEFIALESAGAVPITVTLSNPSIFTVTVNYSTTNGTATAPGDYQSASGALTFSPGVITQTFSVTVNGDSFDGPDETVNLHLGSPISGTLSGDNPETLRILDDDGAPTIFFSAPAFSVNENGGSAAIQVNLTNASFLTVTAVVTTTDGTATRLTDYNKPLTATVTIPGNQFLTSATFTVPITNDTTYEGNETFNVALGSSVNAVLAGFNTTATVTIVDNETQPTVQFSAPGFSVSEAAASTTITATLSHASAFNATVNAATSNGAGVGRATAGSDYTSVNTVLTFNPGVITRTFNIPLLTDTVYEGNESLTVTLSSPVSATLGAPNPATLTIVDDESAPTARLSASAYYVNENAGSAVITATLTGSTAVTATLNFTASTGTAGAGDFTPLTGTLTFTPSVTTRTFGVTINNDVTYEGNETVNLSVGNPVSATLGSPSTATLTIFDDDPRPGCAIYASSDVPQPIPDASPVGIPGQVESMLTLPGPGVIITDVSVRIDQITHTNDQDLIIYLVPPSGPSTGTLVIYRAGGSGDNFFHTILADSFSTPIVSGAAPFTGNFQPDSPLSAFDGLASGGTWRLRVTDNENLDIGTLDAWGLEVCGSVPAPTSFLYLPLVLR